MRELCESYVLPPLLLAATKAILREERSEEVEHGSTVAPRVVRRSIFTGQRFVRTVRVLLVIVRLFLLLLLRLPFFPLFLPSKRSTIIFRSRGIIRFLKNNSSSDHWNEIFFIIIFLLETYEISVKVNYIEEEVSYHETFNWNSFFSLIFWREYKNLRGMFEMEGGKYWKARLTWRWINLSVSRAKIISKAWTCFKDPRKRYDRW